jgi:hypothetical protein
MLQETVLKAGENDGIVDLNSVAVDPFTKSRSGTKGLLHFPVSSLVYLYFDFPWPIGLSRGVALNERVFLMAD